VELYAVINSASRLQSLYFASGKKSILNSSVHPEQCKQKAKSAPRFAYMGEHLLEILKRQTFLLLSCAYTTHS
jgi:hypothetical protein